MRMDQVYKVLIVDDEADIVELLQYNLEKEGYQVKQPMMAGKHLGKPLHFCLTYF